MEKNNRSLVSIIMVNWNGGEVFEDTLASLSKIDYPEWELILVDNGSTDDSLAKVKKYSLKNKTKVIQNTTNVGFAPANNQGYETSMGKYLLFLNNDTKVEVDFLTKMVERMEQDKNIGALQPKIYMMDKGGYLDNAGSFLTWTGFSYHWGFGNRDTEEFNHEREIFAAKGACMLVRREVIEKVGLFDPEFVSYYEESDFCHRVWIAGYKVLYSPVTSIQHKIGFTSQKLQPTEVNYHSLKNRIASFIKNFEFWHGLRFLFIHLTILKVLAFIWLVKFQFSKFRMVYKAIWWNIANFSSLIKKRRRVQKIRVVKDSNLSAKIQTNFSLLDMLNHFTKVEKNFKK